MNLRITRCAKTIANRTITNTSRRRTTTSWKRQSSTTSRDRPRTARKTSRPNESVIPSAAQRSRGIPGWTLSGHSPGSLDSARDAVAPRRRVARGLDGAAASVDPWRLSNERRARRRGRAQAQARLRLPASQSRKDRREHQLPRLDALHRSARLHLLHEQQLG